VYKNVISLPIMSQLEPGYLSRFTEYATGSMAKEPLFDSQQKQEIYFFSLAFRPPWGRRGLHIGYWWESQKERDHCEDQHTGGWTILKWILER
jgi:hypothetical protein